MHRSRALIAGGLLAMTLAVPVDVDADTVDDLAGNTPDGVKVFTLIQHEVAGNIGLTFDRHRLEPAESIAVERHGGGSFGADSFYVDDGLVVVTDRFGGEDVYAEGDGFTRVRPESINDLTSLTIRNDGDTCAVVLRLSSGGCTQCGGGPMNNPIPPAGPSRNGCAPPLEARLLMEPTPTPRAIAFLARVVMLGDAEWDFGDRLGHAIVLVEHGQGLAIDEPTGGSREYAAGQGLEVWPNAPHRVRNVHDTPLSFLIFGMVSDQGGSSVLEIHRARCPTGAWPPSYQNCHHLGQPDVFFTLEGPDRLHAVGVTEIVLSRAVPSPGPGVAIFRGLAGGRYRLSEFTPDDGRARVSIYCTDRTGGVTGDAPELARSTSPDGIDIDIPDGAYVVCDWYALAT